MQIGKIIKNRYIVKSKIGSGGMADVFLVTDKIIKKDFAMKMMKDEIKVGKSNERFKAEANVLAKISCRNVVQIHDAFLGEDYGSTRKFIVMEYVDGDTLQKYMRKSGILTNRDSIRLIGQVLNALRHMHSKNIIHRDIKPQNILLSHDGVIKLIDFGIVKTPNSEQLTRTGNVVGSAQYISPEILAGEKESPCSDIYATGVIFYTMLTGVIPFNGTDISKILKQKMSNVPEPMIHYNEKVDPKLATIVMKSLSRETEYRYQTAEEMLIDIKRYIEGKSLSSTTRLRKNHLSQKEKDSLNVKKTKKTKNNIKPSTTISKVKNKLSKKMIILFSTMIGLGSIVIIVIMALSWIN